jgi:hypothetical protein
MVLTFPWDQNDTNVSCIPPVLEVSDGDSQLNEHADGLRVGVPPREEYQTRSFLCEGKKYSASLIGKEGSTTDDIDDFSGTSSLEVVEATTVDYVEKSTVSISVNVKYISDTANYDAASVSFVPGTSGTGTTNIKWVDVTLTSSSGASELQKTIKLSAFACNVGAIPVGAFDRRKIP